MAVVLAASACSSDSTETTSFEVLEQYVARAADGDFEGANDLRCASIRIVDANRESFLDEVDRLGDAAGVPLEAVDIRELDDITISPQTEGAPERQLAFALRTADGSSGGIQVVTVVEDGEERLCGHAMAQPVDVNRRLDEPIASSGSSIADLEAVLTRAHQELADGSSPPPYSIDPVDGLPPHGRTEEWGVSWMTGDRGGATLSGYRFEDAASAAAAATEFVDDRAPDATAVFDVDAMPNAVGFRHAGSAWTMLQPFDVGEQIDLVVAQYDDTVLWFAVSPVLPDDDHTAIDELAAVVAS